MAEFIMKNLVKKAGMDDRVSVSSLAAGGDKKHKVHLLMEYTDRPGEVADPWFTGDFDTTFRDVLDGCRGVLKEIIQGKR